jgi:hypothetical protein
VDSLSLHRCVGVSGPQHICAPIHYFNALRLSSNTTDIASMHHRHRRPPPVQSFTPYPPIHLTDLSRPPAWQPSRPGLPISQLLPPRRRHTCTTLRFGASAGVAHTSGQCCCPPTMLVFTRNPLGGIALCQLQRLSGVGVFFSVPKSQMRQGDCRCQLISSRAASLISAAASCICQVNPSLEYQKQPPAGREGPTPR